MHGLSIVLASALTLAATQSQASCRKALALGLDVSGSVDAAEYRLQLDGLAAALSHPEVEAAFLAIPKSPVRLFIYEWAGQGSQRRIVDWTIIDERNDLERISEVLRTRPRFDLVPSTGLGEAMLYGGGALAAQEDCWDHVLDLSGDGKSNAGVLPSSLDGNSLPGVTVNGLVVGISELPEGVDRQKEMSEVVDYYASDVIRGPGAFVVTAESFIDFEVAMTRKLLRELQNMAIVQLRP